MEKSTYSLLSAFEDRVCSQLALNDEGDVWVPTEEQEETEEFETEAERKDHWIFKKKYKEREVATVGAQSDGKDYFGR